MTAEEFQQSELFFHSNILPQIYRDCLRNVNALNNSNNNEAVMEDEEEKDNVLNVMDNWILTSNRFRVSQKLGEEWLGELEGLEANEQSRDIRSHELGVARVENIIRILDEAYKEMVSLSPKGCSRDSTMASVSMKSVERNANKVIIQKYIRDMHLCTDTFVNFYFILDAEANTGGQIIPHEK